MNETERRKNRQKVFETVRYGKADPRPSLRREARKAWLVVMGDGCMMEMGEKKNQKDLMLGNSYSREFYIIKC
jgi:hypothetical protein